jgi:ketosteroid isomerase-like protein
MATSEFLRVIEDNHRAVDAFVKGDAAPLGALYSRADDATLANPFGPPVRGWVQIESTMAQAAALYRQGEATGFELVATYETEDLAYVVELEQFLAMVGGAEERTPLALRVTTIFRREHGAWRIVHRHADPITTPRSPESVVWS